MDYLETNDNVFESIKHIENGMEFWYARELMEVLGYKQWRRFEEVIDKAKNACEASKNNTSDHFADVGKMVDIGSNTKRELTDYITNIDDNDYICISDFGKLKEGKSKAADVIRNWLRTRSTLDFLTVWEQINNPNFKVFESEHFRKQVGLLTFTPSVTEWCEKTNAIGIYSKRGKNGGTYAHKDVAFEFASSISPVFKLYLIKEFERLKELENQNREWDVKRILTKNNYLIHIDAIKNYILPDNDFYKNKEWLKYAEEADILNVILFHTTAKKWRELNPELAKNSNLRDYATINELTVLSNLESHNAELIKEGKTKEERFDILNKICEYQLNILNNAEKIRFLNDREE